MTTEERLLTDTRSAPIAARRKPARGARSIARAIYIIWYRDMLRFWRDRARMVGSLAQPLLFLIIFGTGLSSSLSGLGGGAGAGAGLAGAGASVNYIQFMFPGIIGMSVLFSAIFGSMSIVWDREFGFMREILVSPIDRGAVAVGKALGGATQAMIQGLIILVLAPFVGVPLTVTTVVLLIPFTFVLAFGLASMGVAIASRMKSQQAFMIIVNFLTMPIFFLSGALFPLTNLPAWMDVLTHINPASYGIDPLRRVVLGQGGFPPAAIDHLSLTIGGTVLPMALEAVVVVVFGFVMLGVAIYNFRLRD